ncbi:MAG: ATP-binding cassette domain-containing protein [Alphaproteobacteria bacterium]|nr:ATP-binding cassette domain-containing protein [Alphaproteobacteria bacterium]MBT5860900.1 ATP-binding cassette domain-containing protein [Alphaproteobacteria bacterium]
MTGLETPLGPISFEIADGECLAVTGPSGGGKSLLLRALADLDPNTGQVALDGQPREAIPAPEWRKRVTYVATEPGWWANQVWQHFADWGTAIPLVQRLGLVAECADWPISRLSTGERQRLGLARALVLKPRVLLLDEVTSGLDGDPAKSANMFRPRRYSFAVRSAQSAPILKSQ